MRGALAGSTAIGGGGGGGSSDGVVVPLHLWEGRTRARSRDGNEAWIRKQKRTIFFFFFFFLKMFLPLAILLNRRIKKNLSL
jgi:hypothetical protein